MPESFGKIVNVSTNLHIFTNQEHIYHLLLLFWIQKSSCGYENHHKLCENYYLLRFLLHLESSCVKQQHTYIPTYKKFFTRDSANLVQTFQIRLTRVYRTVTRSLRDWTWRLFFWDAMFSTNSCSDVLRFRHSSECKRLHSSEKAILKLEENAITKFVCQYSCLFLNKCINIIFRKCRYWNWPRVLWREWMQIFLDLLDWSLHWL